MYDFVLLIKKSKNRGYKSNLNPLLNNLNIKSFTHH